MRDGRSGEGLPEPFGFVVLLRLFVLLPVEPGEFAPTAERKARVGDRQPHAL